MILVIDALNQDRFADVLDEMFQLRARVCVRSIIFAVKSTASFGSETIPVSHESASVCLVTRRQ